MDEKIFLNEIMKPNKGKICWNSFFVNKPRIKQIYPYLVPIGSKLMEKHPVVRAPWHAAYHAPGHYAAHHAPSPGFHYKRCTRAITCDYKVKDLTKSSLSRDVKIIEKQHFALLFKKNHKTVYIINKEGLKCIRKPNAKNLQEKIFLRVLIALGILEG
jgi:hypothetical protein